MGKVGRRGLRDRARRDEAEQLVKKTAREQNISVDEAREQLAGLAEIREDYVAAFDGSGMFVKDVRYDPMRQQIEVIVEPITIEGEPEGWTPAARARLGKLRSEIETGLLAKGRQRVAELEIAQVRPARTGLGRLIGLGSGGWASSFVQALPAPQAGDVGPSEAEPGIG